MTGSPPSLASRAVLVVALMLGFYLFALAIAGTLLWLPWAEYQYTGQVIGRFALFCVVGAGVILWSILPRPDRFDAPGPLLARAAQPRLYGELERIAVRTGQAMPSEVYLVMDLNAFVAQRGGIMGFGSRRVMGLGLPLLQSLSVPEFSAVVAHEFGHYHGGDTRLGPWIYKTRSAIGRTLQQLAHHSSWLTWLFQQYGKLFLRISHGISRQQEFTADRLAATTVGAHPLIEGLKRIHQSAAMFEGFWVTEMSPLLGLGYRAPVSDGFRRFSEMPRVQAATEELVMKELAEGKADPYDTHPPLRERVAALAEQPPGVAALDGPRAIALLDGVPELERELVEMLARAHGIERLEPVGWDDAVQRVWIPQWTKMVARHLPRLGGLRPTALAHYARHQDELAVRLQFAPDESGVTPAHRTEAIRVLVQALVLRLVRAGWTVNDEPGAPLLLRRGSVQLDMDHIISGCVEGTITAEEWTARCEALGIASLDLGTGSEVSGDPLTT